MPSPLERTLKERSKQNKSAQLCPQNIRQGVLETVCGGASGHWLVWWGRFALGRGPRSLVCFPSSVLFLWYAPLRGGRSKKQSFCFYHAQQDGKFLEKCLTGEEKICRERIKKATKPQDAWRWRLQCNAFHHAQPSHPPFPLLHCSPFPPCHGDSYPLQVFPRSWGRGCGSWRECRTTFLFIGDLESSAPGEMNAEKSHAMAGPVSPYRRQKRRQGFSLSLHTLVDAPEQCALTSGILRSRLFRSICQPTCMCAPAAD